MMIRPKQTYGYRRVRLWIMREDGLLINHKAVLRLMRKYGLLAQIRRLRPFYQRRQQMLRYENRLNRDFTADNPNQKWITDISYIHTKVSVLYLSCIKDLYDNFIVAYDMRTAHIRAAGRIRHPVGGRHPGRTGGFAWAGHPVDVERRNERASGP